MTPLIQLLIKLFEICYALYDYFLFYMNFALSNDFMCGSVLLAHFLTYFSFDIEHHLSYVPIYGKQAYNVQNFSRDGIR